MITQSFSLVIRMELLIEGNMKRIKQAGDAAHGDRVIGDVHRLHE